MNDEQIDRLQRSVKVFANAIGALAEIEMMKVTNWEREMQGFANAYGESDFYNVVLERRLKIDDIQQGIYG